jgi:hypothetical protein
MKESKENKYGLHRADKKDIPPYKKAMIQYRDKDKQRHIKTLNARNDSKWDSWNFKIEYSARNKFDHILDFFVNLPSLDEELNNEKTTREWYWNPLEPKSLSRQFYYRPEVVGKLRENAGTDALFNEGWMVKYTDGRIDGETTWSDASYLFSANSYYAYIQLYTEQDH